MSVMTPQWQLDASPTQSAAICLHISCVGASLASRVTANLPAQVSFTLLSVFACLCLLIDTPIKCPHAFVFYLCSMHFNEVVTINCSKLCTYSLSEVFNYINKLLCVDNQVPSKRSVRRHTELIYKHCVCLRDP